MQPITPHGGAGPKNRDGIHTEWRNPEHLKEPMRHLWPDPPLSLHEIEAANFLNVYQPLADHWASYENSEPKPRLLKRADNGTRRKPP
jgi:hypothetical protein